MKPTGISNEQRDASKSQEEQEDSGQVATTKERPREIGGPKGLEPTRYGDWERNGRCVDF